MKHLLKPGANELLVIWENNFLFVDTKVKMFLSLENLTFEGELGSGLYIPPRSHIYSVSL